MLNQNQKLNEWEERETRALATEYVDLLVGGYTTYTEPIRFKFEAREINNELALFGYLIDANGYKPIPVNVYFGSYVNMEEVEIKKVLIEEELRKQCHDYIDTLIDTHKKGSAKETQKYIVLTKVKYMNFEVLGLHPNNNQTFNYLVDLLTSDVATLGEDIKDDENIDYNKTDFKDIEELMDWYNDIMLMFDEYYQVDFVTPTQC